MDLAKLSGWIGKQEVAEETLTPALADKFHHTLDLAGQAAREGEAAPRLIHFCLCQPVASTSILEGDGHIARGGFLPPIPLPRRMWAASELCFFGDLIVGQTVQRQSRIADVAFKTGRTGSLCFVTVDHRIEADGVLRATDRQTIVYREEQRTSGSASTDAAPPAEGTRSRSLPSTTALLFRYSALTFNTHRIHYDRPYAVGQEGYPGLVVQGPLQATLLFHFAAEVADGTPPDRFSFRSQLPVFDFDDVHLVTDGRDGDRMALWTARTGGPVAMRAEAIWC
ncbi:MAG: MaoC family dehydratase N-terminal domain-containing protein [Alphaproteobacteria bacterium]|nr:MaoC family dehydratase N-terminal domain-containing protein [Alphaproteobacteria bacterium]